MRSQQEIDRILTAVRDRLDVERQATGRAFYVPPDGYDDNEAVLCVLVSPVASGMRASHYVESLGDMERDLRSAGIKDVLLVPAFE